MTGRVPTLRKLPSLIEVIFSSQDKIHRLLGDDAQAFNDMLDEARPVSIRHRRLKLTSTRYVEQALDIPELFTPGGRKHQITVESLTDIFHNLPAFSNVNDLAAHHGDSTLLPQTLHAVIQSTSSLEEEAGFHPMSGRVVPQHAPITAARGAAIGIDHC